MSDLLQMEELEYGEEELEYMFRHKPVINPKLEELFAAARNQDYLAVSAIAAHLCAYFFMLGRTYEG